MAIYYNQIRETTQKDSVKKVFYEKVGRRYVPVAEYDSDYADSFPMGSHLIVVKEGLTLRRYNINPDLAPMMAAGMLVKNEISDKVRKASDLRLGSESRRRPLTEEQHQAWENLIEKLGPDARQLEWPSALEITEACVEAMAQEAAELLENEAVRKAYDHFIIMCKLCKEQDVK